MKKIKKNKYIMNMKTPMKKKTIAVLKIEKLPMVSGPKLTIAIPEILAQRDLVVVIEIMIHIIVLFVQMSPMTRGKQLAGWEAYVDDATKYRYSSRSSFIIELE